MFKSTAHEGISLGLEDKKALGVALMQDLEPCRCLLLASDATVPGQVKTDCLARSSALPGTVLKTHVKQ